MFQDLAYVLLSNGAKALETAGMIPVGSSLQILHEAPKRVKRNPIIKSMLGKTPKNKKVEPANVTKIEWLD